jgi:hypothetical protein
MNGHLTTKNLSRRSRLKKKKQQLCDRINQCKNLKELEGWERTFSYHPVLKDNFEWDEGYFFYLIEFKLKRMREYFWNHNIVVDEHRYGNICNTLVNILNAGYKTNIIVEEDLHNYVNTKNVHRFFTPKQLELILREGLQKYYLPTVREQKAKALFWKYLHRYIEELWD